jgi:hypothetical protein
MDEREITGQEKKRPLGYWDCGFESRRGMDVCVGCIRTVVWNISDMKKDGRI